MNRTGSFISGMALAVVLAGGLTPAMPRVGLGMASADTAQDQALREGLADQFFRVDWNAKPNGHGEEQITGYVYNDYGTAADRVHVRIIALDASGRQIGSFVEPVFGPVLSLDRAYFDVKVPGQAASYRVFVDSFDFVEGVK